MQDWAREKVVYDEDSARASTSVLNTLRLERFLEVAPHGGEEVEPYSPTTYACLYTLAALEMRSALDKQSSLE